jgi:ketosteroid isomerase-like protein
MRNLSKSLTVFSFLVLLGATHEPARGADSTPLQSLADAETAFAKMATEKGTRTAFLAYLADEGVIFEPGPANGKKTWEKRAPSESLLTWEPNFVAVSRSGDFGYTIGPWEFKQDRKDTEPKAFGQFLSIWKKQKDGAWKVVLDAGVKTPKPVGKPSDAQPQATPMPNLGKIEKIDLDAARNDVRKVERRFAAASAADTGGAIIAFASDDIRVLREGVFPAVGEDGAQLMLNSDHAKTTLQPAGGDISQAGDLAYEYGKYVTERGAGPERGHYVMIWKKNVRGTWRLSVDRRQRQLPAEKKLKE